MNPSELKVYFQSVSILTWIKLVVYTLLFINFGFYIRDDLVIADHTLHSGSTFLDWTSAFATTIDETAWLTLLIIFEIETRLLSGEQRSRSAEVSSILVRFCCYLLLAHTPYAYAKNVYDLTQAQLVPGVTDLCQLAGQNFSYAYNLVYTKITNETCGGLSTASQFYFTDPPSNIIVQDEAGFVIERQLAWIDVVESITWLLILFSIELVVWQQDRGITEGALLKAANMSKVVLYSLLWGAMGYWIYRGHYMFAWDEFVWIVGFVAIEMNVVEWRKDISEPSV